MTDGVAKTKMLWALHRMMFSKHQKMTRYRPSARTYETFRKQFYQRIKGKPFVWTDAHREKVVAANRKRTSGKSLVEQYGLEKADAIKAKQSLSRTGSKNGMFGKKRTDDERQKISDTRKSRTYDQKGINASMYGKVWVTDGTKPFVIPGNVLDHYLSNGFKRGRSLK